jgi:hypothetical protein
MSAEHALHNAALGVVVSEDVVGDVRTTISYKVEGEGDDKRVLKVSARYLAYTDPLICFVGDKKS